MKKITLFLIFHLIFIETIYANVINVDFFSRFNDCYLEGYIKEALYNNHNLKEANHKVEQYRQEIKNQFSSELPKLSVQSNYLGAHFPAGDTNFLIKRNSYILPFKASYEPDFLLKNRDKTKSKKKLYKAQLANQKATYISLLCDVANAYINILLFDYLIEKQLEVIKNKTLVYYHNKRKYENGVIDLVKLNDYDIKLNREKSTYESLIKTQKTTLYNFATLIGQSPENCSELKRGKLEKFEYQETIPEIINSDLIYSRPDIIEAENKLRSAKIDITVAKKELFPSFNITGFLAFDTAGGGNFFSWNTSFAFLLAGLTQDLFQGGAKLANLKIKKERYLELLESYKQADLNAIKEINNALNLIKQDTKSENFTNNKLKLEKVSYDSSKRKFNHGVISKTELLDQQNLLFQKEAQSLGAKALRLSDYITLYKALGGEL